MIEVCSAMSAFCLKLSSSEQSKQSEHTVERTLKFLVITFMENYGEIVR